MSVESMKVKAAVIEEIKEGIAFAHERNVKVYITANILAHNVKINGEVVSKDVVVNEYLVYKETNKKYSIVF